MKAEVEEVQVVSGEVEVTLAYTIDSGDGVKLALTDPGRTRLIDNKGRVWPYKTSSGLNAVRPTEQAKQNDLRWFTVRAGTQRVTAILTFSPPEANAALASGLVFRLSSEQWFWYYNETFTLVFRGLALPTPPQ